MNKALIAVCIALVSVIAFWSGNAMAQVQGPPPQQHGSWTVGDGGTTTLASNISQAKTYRVKNNGPDPKVTVHVYNEENELVDSVEVGHGNSVDVGVPAGGDLKVEDTDSTDHNPDNTLGAAGTYTTV